MILNVEFLILDWMEAELIAQTRLGVEEKWVIPTCGLMR